ncbi:hypothetical protein JCM8202_002427 [Rhodotorula sphaerocarpa]
MADDAYAPTPDSRDMPRDDRDNYPPPRDAGPPRGGAPPPRPNNAPVPTPSNVLGVFGLSIRTQDGDLYEWFGRNGRRVEKAVVVYDQRSGRSRGFGFVTMGSIQDAESAIQDLNGLDLHGRRIRVDFSATQRPHEPTPGEYRGPRRDYDFAGPPRGGPYGGPPPGGDRWASRGGGGGGGGYGGGYGGGGYGGGYGGRRSYDDPYGGESYRAPLPSRGGGGGEDRWGYGGGRDSRDDRYDRPSSYRRRSPSRSRSRSRSPPRRSSRRDDRDRSRSRTRSRSPVPRGRERTRSVTPKRD